MVSLLFVLAFAEPSAEAGRDVSAEEKKDFLELLGTLPAEGEFYTDEAVKKAARYTRVLLALTEKDIAKYDLYPFVALSRGLLDHKEQREYGLKHFDEIAHPKLKLFWGSVLFKEGCGSEAVVKFLQAALESKDQSGVLSQMLGPKFEDFRARVREYKPKEK
jgi:hypothetical protein